MPRVYRGVRDVAVSRSTVEEMRASSAGERPIGFARTTARPPHPVTAGAGTPERLIIVLGRLAPHKRVDVVVAARPRSLRPSARAHVDIVGPRPGAGDGRRGRSPARA